MPYHSFPNAQATSNLYDATDTERLARLHFHIKTGDYFPTLATILGFVEETLGEYPEDPTNLSTIERSLLKSVRKDLLHLHRNYAIVPRSLEMEP